MKRTIIILALTLIGVSAFSFQSFAEEIEENESAFFYEVGADLVSSYLWRGQNLGGLSLQPSVTLGWNGLYLCTWANIGADNWKFQKLNPELDITENVTISGWDIVGSASELTYTRINFGAGVLPSDLGYHILDSDIGTHYQYIKDYRFLVHPKNKFRCRQSPYSNL